MDFASFAKPPPPKAESSADRHLRTLFHDENGVMVMNSELNTEQQAEHNERMRIISEYYPDDNDDGEYLCEAEGCPEVYKRLDDLVDHLSKQIALERKSELGVEGAHIILGRELGCKDRDLKAAREIALTRSLHRKYEEKRLRVVLDKDKLVEDPTEEHPAQPTADAGAAAAATARPAPGGWMERNR